MEIDDADLESISIFCGVPVHQVKAIIGAYLHLAKTKEQPVDSARKAERYAIRRYNLLAEIQHMIEQELLIDLAGDGERILGIPDTFFADHDENDPAWILCDRLTFVARNTLALNSERIEAAVQAYEALQVLRARQPIKRESGEVLAMLKKYRVSASRMCDRWAEGDQAVKNELWKALHGLESDALEVIERAEEWQS